MNPLTSAAALNRLADLIGEAIDRSTLNEREIEDITGIPRTTMKRRLLKPGDFTLTELEGVARFLGGDIDVETLTATIHGRVLA